jgi:hypothetical protein
MEEIVYDTNQLKDASRKVVLRPGFGPGSPTREAGILDRTILPELGNDGSLLEINRFCTIES